MKEKRFKNTMTDLSDPAILRAIHKALVSDLPERILVLRLPSQIEPFAYWVEGAEAGALVQSIQHLVQRSSTDGKE